MSEGNVIVIPMNNCYQCEVEIEAPMDSVHPLCDECDVEFEDWFDQELRMVS